jgi:hypothetical protein
VETGNAGGGEHVSTMGRFILGYANTSFHLLRELEVRDIAEVRVIILTQRLSMIPP